MNNHLSTRERYLIRATKESLHYLYHTRKREDIQKLLVEGLRPYLKFITLPDYLTKLFKDYENEINSD